MFDFSYISVASFGTESFRSIVILCCLLLLWYSTSICTSTTSKELLNYFPFPLLLCSVQFLTASIISFAYLRLSGTYRAFSTGLQSTLVWKISSAYTCGFVLTNIAFSLADAPFVETVKAAEPFTTCIVGLLLLGEIYSTATYLTLIPVCGGVALSCYSNINSFSLASFCVVIAANSCFSARSTFTKLLSAAVLSNNEKSHAHLTRNDIEGNGNQHQTVVNGKEVINSNRKPVGVDAFNLFFAISFRGLAILVPLMLIFEGSQLMEKVFGAQRISAIIDTSSSGTGNTAALNPLTLVVVFLANGLTFTCFNCTSYVVLMRTQLITHAVFNVFRRVFIIFATSLYFQLPLTVSTCMGVGVATLGVFLFGRFKQLVTTSSSGMGGSL